MLKLWITLFLTILTFSMTSQARLNPKKPYVVIYKGKSICDGCETPFVTLFQKRGYHVQLVKHGESTPALLSQASAYVVPGGEDPETLDDAWTHDDVVAIRQYVENGGRYYGSCLGGYWAAKLNWKSIDGFETLDIIPATALEPSAKQLEARIMDVHWDGQPRKLFYQDGPGFVITDPSHILKIYATYDSYQLVAAFLSAYGKGKVAVVGPHPEATDDWYEEDHVTRAESTDDIMKEVLDDLLN